ncbi:MAG TPA: hypothetical protein DCR93_34855, partial [Cytophagales bacterium]|nr:hypothetical protein [Cytophagales bacterium]
VPIYSVTTSSLSLPISLDYKGGGVKVDELATDVGLGWDLTAGGMIARIADPGTPWNQFFMPQPVRYQNGIYPELVDDGQGSTYWTNSTWGQFTPTYNLNTTSNDYFLAIDATDTEPQRTEPEMFSFRFLGRSGTIIRDPNDPNVYYTLPQESLKIETVPGTWNFLITDENGIKYYFEKYADTQAEEDATGEAQPMVPGRTQSFQAYLTKIEAPNGAYISLDYELYRYAYVTHLRDFEIINNFGQTNYEDCPSPDPLTNPLRNYSVVNSQRLVGITAYAVTGRTQNSLIHEAISHVQFTYKATSREDIAIPSDANYPLTQEPQESSALSKIEVFEHGVEKMEYDLSHSYFLSAYHNSNDPYINSLNKRLRLDEVQRVGQPGYTFTYHNANNLPPRLSFAQDKYGYYNGVLSNTNLLPDDLGVGTRTADRSVDNSLDYVYLTTGMLKSVEYPTGGYTEYTFEGNEGGAGARIASIIDYASAAKSEISNELYFEYELATGVVEPIFSEVLDTYYTTPQTPYTQSLCRYTQNMSSALSSLTGRFEDYSVGYGKVTQLHGMDATTGTKGIYGKNVYYFHRDIGTVVGSTTRLGVDFSYKWAKGLPEKNEYFAYENGQFVLVQKEEFEYQVTPERSEVWWLDGAGLNNTATDVDVTTHLPLLVIEKIRPEISNSGYYQPAEFYTEQQKIVTNFQFEAKKVTTGYDTEYIGNDDQRVVSVTEEEFYYNDTYQIPTGSLVTDARDVSGTLVKTSALLTATKHPFDYADPNPGNDNDREDALVDMAALHIWAPA